MEQVFSQIDTNGNGKLEYAEVRQFSIHLHERSKPGEVFDEAKFDQQFENLDKNDDGTISKIELLNSMIDKAQSEGRLV